MLSWGALRREASSCSGQRRLSSRLIARHPAVGQGRRAGAEPEPNHGVCQPAALDGFGEYRKWIGSPEDQGGAEQRSPGSADPCAIGPCRPDRNDGLGRVVDLSMTTWGFIGSGNIGTTVARLAIAAGHDVVLSKSRGPQDRKSTRLNS